LFEDNYRIELAIILVNNIAARLSHTSHGCYDESIWQLFVGLPKLLWFSLKVIWQFVSTSYILLASPKPSHILLQVGVDNYLHIVHFYVNGIIFSQCLI